MNNKTGLHNLILSIGRGNRRDRDELDPAVRSKLTEYLAGQFGSSFSREDIEEIVSQSILNMLIHVGEYRGEYGEKSAWGWAYQIAWNQALKWHKTIKDEVPFPQDGDGSSDPQEYQICRIILSGLNAKTVEEQVDERLLIEKLMKIVENLDPREKEILYLYYVQGWNYRRIAASIGVTPPRITQIVKNILQKCHGQLVLAGFESL